MRPSQCPVFLVPGSSQPFPDPRKADDEGLVAVGGDLSPQRLLNAYRSGVFPWFDDGMPPLWWSPNPRAIIERQNIHVSRSLARRMRRSPPVCTWNQAFEQVMWACAERQEGSWITGSMVNAYCRLHQLGAAHSLEVWEGNNLVGGLYGVQVGAVFAAESMFHRATDASKIALVTAVRSLVRAGIDLFEVQFLTDHLKSMGASELARDGYLSRLSDASSKEVELQHLRLDFF